MIYKWRGIWEESDLTESGHEKTLEGLSSSVTEDEYKACSDKLNYWLGIYIKFHVGYFVGDKVALYKNWNIYFLKHTCGFFWVPPHIPPRCNWPYYKGEIMNNIFLDKRETV